jgi:hypothetical protein
MDENETSEVRGVITYKELRSWGLELVIRDTDGRLLRIKYHMSEAEAIYSSLRTGMNVKAQIAGKVSVLQTDYSGVGVITIIADS